MRNTAIDPPILLKTILDILFWALIIGLGVGILFTISSFFLEIPTNFKINDYEITEFTLPIMFALIIKMAIGGLFIYIVYLLRKVVRSFFKRKLFIPVQIAGLNLIGKLIIIATLAEAALNFLLGLLIDNKVNLRVNLISFDSLLFTLAIGLFFILLSKSFRYARSLQEENELTV